MCAPSVFSFLEAPSPDSSLGSSAGLKNDGSRKHFMFCKTPVRLCWMSHVVSERIRGVAFQDLRSRTKDSHWTLGQGQCLLRAK